MYHALRGEFVHRPPEQSSSIGHSHVLPPEERNEKDAFAVLNRLLQKAAMRLRKMNYCAGAMQVSVQPCPPGALERRMPVHGDAGHGGVPPRAEDAVGEAPGEKPAADEGRGHAHAAGG